MSDDQTAAKPRGQLVWTALDWFEVTILSVSTALLAILLISNVIARTFFQAIYFAEELSEFLIIVTTFIGVSYAARKARHIRMGAFLDSMPPKVEKVFIYIISVVNTVVMFLMAYHSWNYMINAKVMNQTTQALRLPYWITLAVVPLGFFLAGVQYVRTIWKNIIEEDVWQSPEQQSEYEEEVY
jgi:TRAP-type C4-dicarboxylate transport system permease small subunit